MAGDGRCPEPVACRAVHRRTCGRHRAVGRGPGQRRGGRGEDLRRRVGERGLAAEHRQHRLHVLALDLRLEHLGAVDLARAGLDLVGEDARRLDVVEHAGELEQLRRRQAAVGDDVLRRRLDEGAGDPRVERPLSSTLDSVRRRKSCWREMRPRSDVGSSSQFPLPGGSSYS